MTQENKYRRLIEQRLRELNLEAAVVSVNIGKNRGYLFDYLRKGSPKIMPDLVKVRLARELKVAPRDLGVVGSEIADVFNVQGFIDNAEPLSVGGNFPALVPNQRAFRMRDDTMALAAGNLSAGSIVIVQTLDVDLKTLPSGKIVLVELVSRADESYVLGNAIMQFIQPDKLLTNGRASNRIFAIDDPNLPFRAAVRGILQFSLSAID